MRHSEGCRVDRIERDVPPELLASADDVYLGVAGMGCANCANRVRNALLQVPGVIEAEVDHTAGLARVWYRSDGMSVEPLLDAVARAGAGTHHEYLAVPVRGWKSGNE